MAELTASDVSDYTDGRLEDDERTQQLLDAALAAARHLCGWHVSPVRESDVVQVDDVADGLLALPTLQLVTLESVTEDNASVDLAGLRFAIPSNGQPRRAVIAKKSGCWSANYGAVTVVMTHGFAEEAAANWRTAILEAVYQMSTNIRNDPSMKSKQVDDVSYEWFESMSDYLSQSSLLAPYRILPSP